MADNERAVMRDAFDESFDEFIEKGWIEETGSGSEGEPVYRLTDKAIEEQLYLVELWKALANNSPAEILKRIAKSN